MSWQEETLSDLPPLSEMSTAALEESVRILRQEYEIEEIKLEAMKDRNRALGRHCEELYQAIEAKKRRL